MRKEENKYKKENRKYKRGGREKVYHKINDLKTSGITQNCKIYEKCVKIK
jgi:hypothetical protein